MYVGNVKSCSYYNHIHFVLQRISSYTLLNSVERFSNVSIVVTNSGRDATEFKKSKLTLIGETPIAAIIMSQLITAFLFGYYSHSYISSQKK